eukprot:3386854-Rhodomonas_salina.1
MTLLPALTASSWSIRTYPACHTAPNRHSSETEPKRGYKENSCLLQAPAMEGYEYRGVSRHCDDDKVHTDLLDVFQQPRKRRRLSATP